MVRPALPPSQTDFTSSLVGYLAALGVIAYLHFYAPYYNALYNLLLVAGLGVLPPLLADIFIFRRWREPSAGLSKAHRTVTLGALWRKCLGFAVTLGGFILLYATLPEYRYDTYQLGLQLMKLALPLLLAAAPFYFFWCLKRLDEPWDGYDEMAELCYLRFKGRDWPEIGRHWRNWLVKAFFLPMMLVFLGGTIADLIMFDRSQLESFFGIYALAYAVIMMGDLLYAAMGYALTLRPLNAHIKSSEPTMLGWVVAVACYPPFWQVLLFIHYFNYGDAVEWEHWITMPWLQVIWGSTILLLMAVYALATVALGIRFSNLTYRGVITSGPYRFTKHPAYVAKNISWWLVSIPFIAESWQLAVTNCLLLLGVNVLYYLRAITEERHLSNYPEYVEYALAMNERSIFRWLTAYLPFLQYKVPANPPRI